MDLSCKYVILVFEVMELNRRQKLLLGSSCCSATLLLCIFGLVGLAPLGDLNLMASDLGSQYLPFLSWLKQMWSTGGDFLYSFSNGIGDDMLPLIAYYLISPFNLIALLFPLEQLPVAVTIIITLKVAAMSMAMTYYLSDTYRTTSWSLLIFSLSYSCCGFVVMYFMNFMWLDALIFLPLVTLGLQRLWDTGRYWLYSLSLFEAIVTNYYLGYMICLYAVIYSIYWYFRQNPDGTWRKLLRAGRLFLVSSLLTGVATSFILLPALSSMLQTKKTSMDWMTFLPTPKFGFEFLAQLGLGGTNFAIRLDHLPTIFSGILMTILCLAYFFLPTVSRRAKWLAGGLLFSLFLSMWLETFFTIWHMFQSPAGFPYRNTFLVSFLLVKFAFEAWQQLEHRLLPWQAPLLFSLLLLLAAVWSYRSPQAVSVTNLLLTLVFIWGYVLLLRLRVQGLRHMSLLFVLLSVMFELGLNGWLSVKDVPFGQQTKFAQTFQAQKELLTALPDDELFRIKQSIDSPKAGYQEQNNGYNNSFLYGYAGISEYSSTLKGHTQNMLNDIGLYEKNDRRISYVDNSKLVNLLFNVKYQITPWALAATPIAANDQGGVYQNSEAIGMGFMGTEQLQHLQLQADQPIANQEEILQAIRPAETNYFQASDILTSQLADRHTKKLTIRTTATGDLYLYIPGIHGKNVKELSVNGHVVKPAVFIATNQVFNLGAFDEGAELQLALETTEATDPNDWIVTTLAQTQFDLLIAEKKQESLHLQKDYSRLTGTVSAKEAGTLFLAIPFDADWQISVDGQRQPVIKVMNGLMAVVVSQGTHQVQLVYRSRALVWGISISSATILGVIVYQLFRRQRRKGS